MTLVPQGGIIADNEGSLPAIAYGAVAGMFQPTMERGRRLTLSDATGQLVAQLQQSNPHLHLAANSSGARRLAGQEGYSVTALGQSPVDGESEVNWIFTSFRPEGLWYVVFITPENDWNQYQPVFQSMLNSVRFPR